MARKKLDINAHVGRQMRARRIALALSQGDVGRGLGIAAQQVQKYEAGTNAANAQRLYDFAQFLKVPIAYFFDGLETPSGGLAAWAAGSKQASDRESLEILKSFKRIRDYGVRKRIADLLRSLSLKDI